MPKSVRTRAHNAVMAVLMAAREEAGLTQRELANLLPAWLEWGHITVAKVETGRRNIGYIEVREYARAVGLDVATVERRATELAAGRKSGLIKRGKRKSSG